MRFTWLQDSSNITPSSKLVLGLYSNLYSSACFSGNHGSTVSCANGTAGVVEGLRPEDGITPGNFLTVCSFITPWALIRKVSRHNLYVLSIKICCTRILSIVIVL